MFLFLLIKLCMKLKMSYNKSMNLSGIMVNFGRKVCPKFMIWQRAKTMLHWFKAPVIPLGMLPLLWLIKVFLTKRY